MLINPTFYDIDQNSEDWDILRSGKFTASMFSDICSKPESKGYQNAITKVTFEILTGKTQKMFTNQWMDYGHETEPEADENYCIETFNQTENGGFWALNEFVGASPDRKIVGENAGTEYKCISFSTYREYLESIEKKGIITIPKDYMYQMQGQMLCTGWDYIDFMPYLSPNLKQLLTRVYRDENIIKEIVERLGIAINEVEILINKYKR